MINWKFFVVMICLSSTIPIGAAASASSTKTPSRLVVSLSLSDDDGFTCPSSFERFIVFYDEYNDRKVYVLVHFEENSHCTYLGEAEQAGSGIGTYVPAMTPLGVVNNRNHWDKMYFASYGGGTPCVST